MLISGAEHFSLETIFVRLATVAFQQNSIFKTDVLYYQMKLNKLFATLEANFFLTFALETF